MHIMSFSEREYIDVPEEAIIENGQSYFGLSNTLFRGQQRRRAHERVPG